MEKYNYDEILLAGKSLKSLLEDREAVVKMQMHLLLVHWKKVNLQLE